MKILKDKENKLNFEYSIGILKWKGQDFLHILVNLPERYVYKIDKVGSNFYADNSIDFEITKDGDEITHFSLIWENEEEERYLNGVNFSNYSKDQAEIIFMPHDSFGEQEVIKLKEI